MSVTQQMVDLIAAHPGIRSVELEEKLNITNASAKLAARVAGGHIRAERVQAPNGSWVNAYYPVDGAGGSEPAEPGRRGQRGGNTLVAALFTNGELVIEVGRKGLRLTAQETRELITYLDRVNVDQILPRGVIRHAPTE